MVNNETSLNEYHEDFPAAMSIATAGDHKRRQWKGVHHGGREAVRQENIKA